MVLEADEVVAVGTEVLLAKLDAGVGPAAGLGVGEADGLHGAEAEGIAATAGGLFDGEAAFEVLELFGFAGGCGFLGDPGLRIETWGTRIRGLADCGDLFPLFGGNSFGGGEGFDEAVVLLFGEG